MLWIWHSHLLNESFIEVRSTDPLIEIRSTDLLIESRSTDPLIEIRSTDPLIEIRSTDLLIEIRSTDPLIGKCYCEENTNTYVIVKIYMNKHVKNHQPFDKKCK